LLRAVFWDVQHGHATYIKTPNEKHIVIDLGIGSYKPSNSSFSPLLHLKDKWGIKQLDCVIITHPHRDHIDDIFNFDKLAPRVLLRPKHLSEEEIRAGNRETDRIIDKYLEINKIYTNPVVPGDDPFLQQNNGGVQIQCFTPSSCGTSNLNNHSIVTVLSYAQSKMIIPGDNEPVSWDELLKRTDFLTAIKDTDILLAPHHGRDSGFSSALFAHINPRLTIISDGPFCDTSATSRYALQTRGWTVYKSNGSTETRKCVTTRNDGVIDVQLGNNTEGKPYIHVKID
jgi:beta-lactamase superfamily II metal-dependent hydrolase